MTASTRRRNDADEESIHVCLCGNRDTNSVISALHQRVKELQAQCDSENAARASAEARAERAESSLAEAQNRISSLEVALRECAGVGFSASSGE